MIAPVLANVLRWVSGRVCGRITARNRDIERQIGLDTRLQIQTAKMLRTFLNKDQGVSLRTIARLVVLVLKNIRERRLLLDIVRAWPLHLVHRHIHGWLDYKVAGVANLDSKGDILIAEGSGRTITVRSVEEILRRNRLDTTVGPGQSF